MGTIRFISWLWLNQQHRQGNVNNLPKNVFCRATVIYILSLGFAVATTETKSIVKTINKNVVKKTTYRSILFNIKITCMYIEMCLIYILFARDNSTKKCENTTLYLQLPCINHDKLQTYRNYLHTFKKSKLLKSIL